MPDIVLTSYVDLEPQAVSPGAPLPGKIRVYLDADGVMQTITAADDEAAVGGEDAGGGAALTGSVPPVNGVNAIWDVEANNNPTEGTFRLRFRGETTAAIPFDATSAEVCTALEALSTIGAGNVQPEPSTAAQTLADDGAHYIMFIRDLGVADVEGFEIIDDTTDGELSVPEDSPGVSSDQQGSPPDPVGVLGQKYLDTVQGIEYTYSDHQGSLEDNLDFDPVGWVPTGPPGTVRLYDPEGRLRGLLDLQPNSDGLLRLFGISADGQTTYPLISYYTNEGWLKMGPLLVDTNGLAGLGNARFGPDYFMPDYNGVANQTPRMSSGFDDPSTGGGVAGAPGSIYQQFVGANEGHVWIKTGSADTAWAELATVP